MTRETWLITDGAVYIGTHIADLFLQDGKDGFPISSGD